MIENYNYDGWGLCPETFLEIQRILPKGSTILELGSGSGTEVLSREYSMISIEDDPKFIGNINLTIFRFRWFLIVKKNSHSCGISLKMILIGTIRKF